MSIFVLAELNQFTLNMHFHSYQHTHLFSQAFNEKINILYIVSVFCYTVKTMSHHRMRTLHLKKLFKTKSKSKTKILCLDVAHIFGNVPSQFWIKALISGKESKRFSDQN